MTTKHKPMAFMKLLALVLAAACTCAHAGDEQHRLAALSGLWNVKQSLWLVAGQPPQVDPGTAVFTMVLGGRHLQQDLRVSSSTPFQGIGYTGYDTATGRYFSSWMDVNLGGALLLSGDYDAAHRVYRFSGTMPDQAGQPIATREELQVLDEDHFVARYYETRKGSEALVVELAYSRP